MTTLSAAKSARQSALSVRTISAAAMLAAVAYLLAFLEFPVPLKLCYSVCPQKCIDISQKSAVIDQNRCLHCGRCAETCPKQIIKKKG